MKESTELVKIRQSIQETRLKFQETVKKQNRELSIYLFNKFDQGEDVPYNDLAKFPIGETLPLPVVVRGTIMTKRLETDHGLRYCTDWSTGASLTRHYHSDAYEEMVVKEGTFKVMTIEDSYILEEGDRMEFAPNEVHSVTALTKGKCEIKFIQIHGSYHS